MEGQLSLLEQDYVDYEEVLIKNALLAGSGFENGKVRIVRIFSSDMSKGERAKSIADEYGIGGSSYCGRRVDSTTQGLRIYLTQGGVDVTLTWGEVESRIGELILNQEY